MRKQACMIESASEQVEMGGRISFSLMQCFSDA